MGIGQNSWAYKRPQYLAQTEGFEQQWKNHAVQILKNFGTGRAEKA